MCSLKRQKHQKLMPISMLESTLEVTNQQNNDGCYNHRNFTIFMILKSKKWTTD